MMATADMISRLMLTGGNDIDLGGHVGLERPFAESLTLLDALAVRMREIHIHHLRCRPPEGFNGKMAMHRRVDA